MRYEEVVTSRDLEALQIPQGNKVSIPAGTTAFITQALGDSYTIQIPTVGGLFRIAGEDGDALGKEKKESAAKPQVGGAVTEEQVWEELRKVYDPEIPVNIVELGLVYDMRVEPSDAGSRVLVIMTLTAPGCGMGTVIAGDAQRLIEAIPGVVEADVQVTFDPPWNQQMMSEAARLELGLD